MDSSRRQNSCKDGSRSSITSSIQMAHLNLASSLNAKARDKIANLALVQQQHQLRTLDPTNQVLELAREMLQQAR